MSDLVPVRVVDKPIRQAQQHMRKHELGNIHEGMRRKLGALPKPDLIAELDKLCGGPQWRMVRP